MTMELDPLFVKALKLLHSRNKDAVDQLKKLVDDVLGKRKLEESDRKETGSGRIGKQVETKSRDAEKRDLEKLQEDLAELSQDVIPAKKLRLDTGKESKTSKDVKSSQDRAGSSRSQESKDYAKASQDKEKKDKAKDDLPDWVREKEKEMEREREERNKEEKDTTFSRKELRRRPVVETSSSDSETEEEGEEDKAKPMDTEDFDLFQGLSCVVCRQMNVTSGNQLVECQECHNLYHQECHRPAVIEKNVNDPRFVWYCSRCARNMSKVVLKPQKSKPVPPAVTKEAVVTKPAKPESVAILQPFKRVEAKTSSSKETGNSSGRPLAGLASLAASVKSHSSESGKLVGKTVSQKSHSSSTALFSNPDVMRTSKPESSKPSTKSSESSKSSHHKSEIKLSTVNPFVRTEISRSSSSSGKSDVPRSSSGSLSRSLSGSSSGSKASTSSSTSLSSSSGLAKMAAAHAPSTMSSAAKAASAQSSGSRKMSQSHIMSADQRLQMMKKKAAAKHLEKRSYK